MLHPTDRRSADPVPGVLGPGPGLSHAAGRLRAGANLMRPGKKKPAYLIVYVTSRCDAACSHCFFWDRLNRPRREITLAQYEDLARSIGPTLQVTLTGGSPELRSDLAGIAQVFHRNCRPVNMTMCLLGRHTSRVVEQVEQTLRTCPDMNLTIGLSLDGMGEEHDRLRKMPGLFDHLTRTFEELGNLRATYPRLYLHAGITVTALNHTTVVDTANWAYRNLPVDAIKPVLVRGDGVKDPASWDAACFEGYVKLLELDRQNAQRDRRSLYQVARDVKENVQRDLIQEIFTTGKSPVTCAAARETAVIWPEGNVGGCEMRPDIFGNLHDTGFDFPALYFAEAADAFRDSINSAPECSGCYHHCFLTPAIARSPKMWGRVGREVGTVLRASRPRTPADCGS